MCVNIKPYNIEMELISLNSLQLQLRKNSIFKFNRFDCIILF